MVDELPAELGDVTLLTKFARETCYYEVACHPARNLLCTDYDANSLVVFEKRQDLFFLRHGQDGAFFRCHQIGSRIGKAEHIFELLIGEI